MKRLGIVFLILMFVVTSCDYEVSIDSSSDNSAVNKLSNKKEKRTDIEFTATSESVVEAGEVFQLTYTVNENVDNFSASDFKDFEVLAGPFTSSSSSTQIINGKRSRKVNNSYVYNISASKPGTYTLEPAEVEIAGYTYQSNPIEIKVIGELKEYNKTDENQNSNTISSDDDIFLLTRYSSTNVYKGEYIVATTKIYTLKDFQNISEIKFPDYEGFWTETLKAPRQLDFQNEILNGKKYHSALLKQTLLFSQNPGNFTISPYEIELQIKKKDGKTRDFFGNIVDNYKLINKQVTSNQQIITVKPLPQPVPDNFSGITGKKIEIKTELDQTDIKTDESANLRITISGNGNLHLLNELNIELPEGLEHFKPQIEKTEKFSETGAYGERIFDFILVGNKIGTYKIEPFVFIYFDTDTKNYKTITGEELNLNVSKGSGFVPLDDEKNLISKDIRHIKSDDTKLHKMKSSFSSSFMYYLVFIVLIILFVSFLAIRRRYIDVNSDKLKLKKKNAGKISQKRLKTALKYKNENDKQAFYKEILTSIWGYLSDKMSVSADSLTKDSIQDILIAKNISAETINKIMQVIEICGYAQYGPTGEEGEPELIYNDTAEIINDLETVL